MNKILNKNKILIIFTVIFLFLSSIVFIDRVLIPNIKNNKYLKEQEKKQAEIEIENFIREQEKGDPEESEEDINNYEETVVVEEKTKTKDELKMEAKQKVMEYENEDPAQLKLPENDSETVGFAVGQYYSYINNTKYKLAYSMLADSFKKINFPTYEEFEKYCKKTYKGYSIVKYIYYQRMSDVLLVEVEISDAFENFEKYKKTFTVFEEKQYEYKLSFGLDSTSEDDSSKGD